MNDAYAQPVDEDALRDDFRAWIASEDLNYRLGYEITDDGDQTYLDNNTHAAWLAYKAARSDARARAAGALMPYVKHQIGCASHSVDTSCAVLTFKPCTCELDAILASLNPQPAKPNASGGYPVDDAQIGKGDGG